MERTAKPARGALWWVAAATLLALLIRLWNLGRPAFWTDEVYSLHVATRDLPALLADRDQTPPLFVLLEHFWTRAFGTGEFAVRLPSALLGAATVPAVFFISRRMMPHPWPVVAAFGCALFEPLVILSQDARTYSLFTFLTAASVLALLRYEEQPTWRRGAVYGVASAALLWAHAYGVLYLLAHHAYVASGRSRLRFWTTTWLLPQVVAGLLFLPWVPALLGATARVAGGFWLQPMTWHATVQILHGLTGGRWVLYCAIVLVAALAAWDLRELRRHHLAHRAMLLWTWMGITTLLPWLVSFRLPILAILYAMPASVPLLILMTRSLSRLPRGRLAATFVVGAVLLATLGGFFMGGQQDDNHQDWHGVTALVDGAAKSGAVLLFNQGSCDEATGNLDACAFGYYSNRSDLRLVGFFPETKGRFERLNDSNIRVLDDRITGAPEAWVILSFSNDEGHRIERRLGELGWTAAGSWHFKRIDLLRFTPPAMPAPPPE